jgi:hypothetical protein
MFILVMCIFARVNPFPVLIDSFRQKRLERRKQLDTVGIPLEQLQPMIAFAPQVIIPGNVYPYVVNLSAPIDAINRTISFLSRIQL